MAGPAVALHPETTQERSTDRPRFPFLASALLLLLFLVGYAPLLTRFASEQWGRAQYQFFPLMIVSAIFIAFLRLRETPLDQLPPRRSSIPAVATVLIAVLLFAAASVLWSGRLAATSALLSLMAIAAHVGGRAVFRALVPSFILLALVIGPPLGYEETLLQRLRELAVSISSGVLILLNIPHLTTGTIIEIPGSRLLVAEACSGINSLMAVIGCTFVIAFVRRRSWRIILALIFSGVLFVLWANIVRIAGGVWLKVNHDIDILTGDAHELASIILFSICIMLVLCTDEAAGLLRWLLKQDITVESSDTTHTPVAPATRPIGAALWLLALSTVGIGAASAAYAHTHGGIARWLSEPGAVHLRIGASFTGPAQLGQWTRSEDAERFIAQPEIEGKRSQVWAYQRGNLVALVAIDFPFLGYHDLTLCYRNGGWIIVEQELKRDASSPLPGPYTEIDLIRLNERGMVWYAALNEYGEWAEPPAKSAAGRVQRRLQHVGRPDWNSATYQIQLFVHAYEPFSPEQRLALEELFLLARTELGAQVLSQLEAP